jgi:hypothetical protein
MLQLEEEVVALDGQVSLEHQEVLVVAEMELELEEQQ